MHDDVAKFPKLLNLRTKAIAVVRWKMNSSLSLSLKLGVLEYII